MRSSRRESAAIVLILCGAVLCALAPRAHAARAATDAFTVEAPAGEWKRAPAIDPPGRLTWLTSDPKVTTGQMRVSFEGVRALSPAAAVAELLDREKFLIKYGSSRIEGSERSEFVPDSIVTGKLHWYGFRVEIKTGPRSGVVTRWVALHPDFPRRRRGFFLALDEQTLPDARLVSRSQDAIAVMRSLEPRGIGLAGGLADAYLDARTATFAARIDSATRLCWSKRGPDAMPSRAWLGVGRGLAIEGDFGQFSDIVPRDSLVDAGSPDYGTGFDRNGDGKVDLLVLNRGICSARGGVVLPIVVVLADDDFDGRIDGSVLENGDADGDGRLDHRILVTDTNHDGRPDQAISFVDAIDEKSAKKLQLENGLVKDRVVGSTAQLMDFVAAWRDAQSYMVEFDSARAACPR